MTREQCLERLYALLKQSLAATNPQIGYFMPVFAAFVSSLDNHRLAYEAEVRHDITMGCFVRDVEDAANAAQLSDIFIVQTIGWALAGVALTLKNPRRSA